MTSSFWLLEPPRTLPRAEEAPGTKSERIICPAHDSHKRGGKRIGDLSVVVEPSGIRDFTWTWLNDLLVSSRVLDLFEKYCITGFEVRPAKISYAKAINVPPPDMFELVVTGWGGFASPAAGVTLVKWCPACAHKILAIEEPSRLIDPASWDGSDLFIVWPLPGYRFCSSRLASILRQERVSGVAIVPATQLPTRRGAHVTPGPPVGSMPEHRARELDRRFGISHWLVDEHQRASLKTER